MSKILKHKGFLGTAEMSVDDDCLYGKALYTRDLIMYEGATPAELKKAFEDAIDDYLDTCREIGIEPKKPCSGTFNVRISPEDHLAAAEAAAMEGANLNDFVKQAIKEKIEKTNKTEVHIHQHQHNHIHDRVLFRATLPAEGTGVNFNGQSFTITGYQAYKEETTQH